MILHLVPRGELAFDEIIVWLYSIVSEVHEAFISLLDLYTIPFDQLGRPEVQRLGSIAKTAAARLSRLDFTKHVAYNVFMAYV
jgi:hypothetical protein